MRKILFAFFLLTLSLYSYAQDGANDPTFNTIDDGSFGNTNAANENIREIIVQPDGKIIIGGYFTAYNGTTITRIARLNTDGSIDNTFNPGSGFNGNIYSMVLQPDGGIIVGGNFTKFNGTSMNCIARLNADGSLDNTFNLGSGFNDAVESLSLQVDGKIIVGGDFTSFNGGLANYITRLNTDGTVDASFNSGSGFNTYVYSTTLQSDGKIIVGGVFGSFNGTAINRIARLNSDGSIDASFLIGNGFNNTVWAIDVQSDGKIIVGGNFTAFNGTAKNRIIRLNSGGSIDASFNPGGGLNNTPHSILIQSDGKIIVGGEFSNFRGISRNRIVRINSDGSNDASFSPGAGFNNTIWGIALQVDGKIISGGNFTTFYGSSKNHIVRLSTDGTIDASFNPIFGSNSSVYSIALQSDGKIIIGGAFTSFNGTTINRIARLNSDGSFDSTFDPGTGFNNSVQSIALQSDGKIIVGGLFTSLNGTSINRIVRLNSDGSIDASFNPGTGFNNSVLAIALQSDGKIIIGGAFTSFNGTAINRIARLNSDGSFDSTFDPGTGFNNSVQSIALQSDGKIIVGGLFTSLNGTSINRIVRLNSDGSIDASFNPGTGFNNSVQSIALQSDGKIIIGGAFTSFNGTAINRIARLNSDGSFDSTFDPGTGFNNSVQSIALQSDGKIIVGGLFTSLNGTSINRIVRLNSDGSIDASFNPGTGFNNSVLAIALQSNGKIITGGEFLLYRGIVRTRIARLINSVVIPLKEVPIVSASSASISCDVTSTSLSAKGLAPGGQVATFNTTTSAVDLGSPASLQITGDQTIEMWIKPNTSNLRRNPFAKAFGGEGTITLEVNGMLSYYYGTSGDNSAPYQEFGSGLIKVPNNKWTHIAIVRDLSSASKTLKWYVNGILANKESADYSTAVASVLPALIGDGYVDNFDGSIDNLRIWNVARSGLQIATDMYLETATAPATGLVAQYNFNGNTDLNAGTGPNGTPTAVTFDTPDHYTYTWSGGPSLPVASTDEIQTTGILSSDGTYNYSVIATVGANSSKPSANVAVSVTTPLLPGTISNKQSICYGETPALLEGTAPTGGGSTYTYQWEKQANCDGNWLAIAGETSSDYQPVALAESTCFRRMVSSVCGVAYSKPVTLSANLKLHFSFDQKSEPTISLSTTSIIDESGNGYNGTLQLATTPTWISNGFDGGAYQLNGTNFIEFPNPGLDNLNQEWTVSAWVNASDLSIGFQYLIEGMNQGNFISFNNKPLLYLNFGANNYFTYGSDGHIQLNKWHQLVFTFNSTTTERKVYLDGVDISEYAMNETSTPIGLSPTMKLGSNFIGMLDDVKIFDKALTDQEVEDLYQVRSLKITLPIAGTPLFPGTISNKQSICHGETPALLEGTAPTGGATYTYQWEQQANCDGNWLAIVGEISSDYQPGVLAESACFRRKVSSDCGVAYSKPVTLNANLKLHFSFDQKSEPSIGLSTTSIIDESGNGYNGTLQLATTPTWISNGFDGGAYQLNGTNFIEFPNPGLDNLNQEWTVSAWVNASDLSIGFQYLIEGMNQGNFISFNNKPLLYLNFSANNYFTYGSDGHIQLNKWHQLVFTFNSTTTERKVYLDGVDISDYSENFTSTPIGLSPTMKLGTNFEGMLDDVKIFDKVLTDQEVEDLYQARSLKIELPIAGTTLSVDGETATCAVKGHNWIQFYSPTGNFLGAVNANGEDLGNVLMFSHVGTPQVMNSCNQPTNPSFNTAYMGRTWVMTSDIYTLGDDFPENVSVRLPFTNTELDDLNEHAKTATPGNPNDGGDAAAAADISNLMLTKISGSHEDGIADINDCDGIDIIRGISSIDASGIDIESTTGTQYLQFSVGQFSEFFLHKNSNASPLPVTLTNFSVTCENGTTLYWSTASEQNSKNFVIEKSRDGKTWVYVAEQKAAGNSNNTINYHQVDNSTINGISYYRLRQIDINGDEEIYGPISVSCNSNENSLSVYPNPNNGSFTIEISSNESHSDTQLLLTDMMGRTLISQSVNISKGTNRVVISNNDLQMGTYFVTIQGVDGQLKPVKVVVNK